MDSWPDIYSAGSVRRGRLRPFICSTAQAARAGGLWNGAHGCWSGWAQSSRPVPVDIPVSGGTPAIYFTRHLKFLIGEEPPSGPQGLYRFSRNPMYVGVLLAVFGQAFICFARCGDSMGPPSGCVSISWLFLEEPHLRNTRPTLRRILPPRPSMVCRFSQVVGSMRGADDRFLSSAFLYAVLTLRGARLRFGCSATASADSSSLDDPAAAVAVCGGLRASRLFFRASMMSITGAM